MSQPTIKTVSLIVRNLEKTMADYSRLLGGGVGPFKNLDLEHMGIRGVLAPMGPLWLELLQPIVQAHPLWKSLGEKDVCLRSLSFVVNDLDMEIARFRELGIHATKKQHDEGTDYVLLDTEKIAGITFQLCQVVGPGAI